MPTPRLPGGVISAREATAKYHHRGLVIAHVFNDVDAERAGRNQAQVAHIIDCFVAMAYY